MREKKEPLWEWEEPQAPQKYIPMANDVVEASTTSSYILEHSDSIIDEVDDHGNPLSYKSGLILRSIPHTMVLTKDMDLRFLHSLFRIEPPTDSFMEYLQNARRSFALMAAKYPVSEHLELRTAIDDLLIAYDQATEKLKG